MAKINQRRQSNRKHLEINSSIHDFRDKIQQLRAQIEQGIYNQPDFESNLVHYISSLTTNVKAEAERGALSKSQTETIFEALKNIMSIIGVSDTSQDFEAELEEFRKSVTDDEEPKDAMDKLDDISI